MPAQQSYANHRRYIPLFHFVILPIFLANAVVGGVRLYKNPTFYNGWTVIVALALFGLGLYARFMAVAAQNRVIRLEERLRLASLMPDDQRARINDLTPRQLIGLRFAADEEAAELAQRCLDGDLKGSEDVKKAVKNWRADNLRV